MSAAFSDPPAAGAARHDTVAVRLLTSDDRQALHSLFARMPTRTLTTRLNLEAHGLQGSLVRSWGGFDRGSGEMLGLLIRYGNTAVAVDGDGVCAAAFAEQIDVEHRIVGVRGSLDVVSGIQSRLKRYVPTDWEDSYFLTLTQPPSIAPSCMAVARRAVPSDVQMLAELYAGAGNMYRNRQNVASKLQESRVIVVEEPALGKRARRIASCALLNVEGADAGLIGGVYTLPSARGKGYAAACTALISIDLQKDGKLPCLFYENPVAGKVYRRLGYKDASRWAVLYLAPPGTTRGGA